VSRSARVLVAMVVCAVLTLAGCSGGGGPSRHVEINDINPKPRQTLRDGGDLRWPIDSLPDNYNYNQLDGASGPTRDVVGALLPFLFTDTVNGGMALNRNYLTSAELTSSNPEVITYTINPRAAWSNGTPITWRDFEAQWKALNGANPAFAAASGTGYEDIGSVAKGSDDRQAVVTFNRTFAEWKGLFSPLYPVSTNADPVAFNTGLAGKLPVTAGPFVLDKIDRAAKTVTLRRSDRWWGDRAKLDRIIFRVCERAALADGLANNEIDFYKIGSNVDLLRRAQSTPGVAIRQSPDRTYNQITFNGAPGTILSDLRLRQAIAKGIDRTAIAQWMIGQIVPNASQHGNHIYAYGSTDYRDNSDALPFDRAAANRELDELGWLRSGPGGARAKGRQPLRLRLAQFAPNPVGEQIDKAIQDQLDQLGVTVVIEPVPIAESQKRLRSGNFDVVGFAWENTATPFSSGRGIYAEPKGNDVRQNYGRISSREIDALFDQGIRELDDTKRAEIGNQVDKLIWEEVHHLPLYPSTGAYAVRSTLANFGAPGFADVDYVNTGYLK